MGNEIIATYYYNNNKYHIYGCWDKETPENEFDFYDIYEETRNPSDGMICVNEGEPFWEFPTRDEVIEFIKQ